MKKLLSLILAFLVLISSASISGYAVDLESEEYSLYVGGVGMKKGEYLAVGESETQIDKPESQGYAFYNGSDLILVNYSYTGEGFLCKVKYDKYTTINYPTVIYSKTPLSLVIKGECSLVGKHASYTTRAIYSDSDVSIRGDGKLFLKAKRAVYATGEVKVTNTFLDIYSEYFYGIYSEKGSIMAQDASVRIKGSLGMQTFTNGKYIKFSGSHVDINVTDMGLFSSGNIVIDDSYVKIVSYNPEYPESYCSIYTSGGDIIYTSVEGKGSFSASGNNAVVFDNEESAGYHWVEFSRKKLSYIDIVDIAMAESYAYPDFKGKAESPYTEIINVEWFELNGDTIVGTITEDKYFDKNKKYRLRVTVKAGYSYEFDDINTTAYIGNSQVANYCKDINKKIRVLEIDYIATSNPENRTLTIGNVTLKDGDYLINGDSQVTTKKPTDNYAYYQNGVLLLKNFVDKKADIVFSEGYLSVRVQGYNKISSISDTHDKDEEIHEVAIYDVGELDIVGSNSTSSRTCGVNISGVLFVTQATVNIDADITYCIDAKGVSVTSGELYCHTAQGGVFAGKTEIIVYGGVFHAFDAGCWAKFINEQVYVAYGVVYVSDDVRTGIENASVWNGQTPLNDYEAVWVVAKEIEKDPETSEPDDEPDYLLGDVNNDGTVDSTDYLRIKSHFLGLLTLEDKAFKAGDVDFNSEIDSTDYLRIKMHFLGTYNLHE